MTEDRIHRTRSDDGNEIAARVHGDGPPLVFVHGGLGDDQLGWASVVPWLTGQFTCYTMSTRGRGAERAQHRVLARPHRAGHHRGRREPRRARGPRGPLRWGPAVTRRGTAHHSWRPCRQRSSKLRDRTCPSSCSSGPRASTPTGPVPPPRRSLPGSRSRCCSCTGPDPSRTRGSPTVCATSPTTCPTSRFGRSPAPATSAPSSNPKLLPPSSHDSSPPKQPQVEQRTQAGRRSGRCGLEARGRARSRGEVGGWADVCRGRRKPCSWRQQPLGRELGPTESPRPVCRTIAFAAVWRSPHVGEVAAHVACFSASHRGAHS